MKSRLRKAVSLTEKKKGPLYKKAQFQRVGLCSSDILCGKDNPPFHSITLLQDLVSLSRRPTPRVTTNKCRLPNSKNLRQRIIFFYYLGKQGGQKIYQVLRFLFLFFESERVLQDSEIACLALFVFFFLFLQQPLLLSSSPVHKKGK